MLLTRLLVNVQYWQTRSIFYVKTFSFVKQLLHFITNYHVRIN